MALSGYRAKLYVGAANYIGADLTNVSVSINHEPVSIDDLASTWKERAAGVLSWELTGTKNYATAAFLSLAATASMPSVQVFVYKPASTSGTSSAACFGAWGIITRGVTTFPMGAATEEITIVGAQKSMATGSQVRVNA